MADSLFLYLRYYDKHPKPINILCGQNAGFLNVGVKIHTMFCVALPDKVWENALVVSDSVVRRTCRLK